jgi:hypothetical protein
MHIPAAAAPVGRGELHLVLEQRADLPRLNPDD